MSDRPAAGADLSPTALYTAGVWAWAGLPGAELLDHKDARRALAAVTFALAVARPFRGDAPSLRHSLVQRHVMLDALLGESGATAVLELAAGLSARGARATADPRITYVEVDRAGVIENKRTLLGRTAAGRAVLSRPNLRLLAGDALASPLAELAPPATGPRFVIAEGLLMYLDAAAQRALFSRVRELLEGSGGTFAFDLVPAVEQPPPGVVGRPLGWLMRKLTRGGGFARDQRTRDELAADLRTAGFGEVRLLEPRTAPAAWRVPHLDRPTQQLVFAARVVPR